MKWMFNNNRPIYAQLVEQIQIGILSGEYPPGSGVPSVRTLALEAEVNPNTMQKALAELETQGLLYTNRTAGRFVTEDMNMINELREKKAEECISIFLDGMKSLGIEGDEAIKLIDNVLQSDKSKEVN